MEIKDFQHQLTRTEDWVKNADTKIGVLLSFDAIFLVLILRQFVKSVFSLTSPVYLIVGYIAVLVLLAWSIFKALWGIVPRLNHGQGKRSPLYFYDIQEMKLRDYKRRLKELKTAEYKDELVSQIHAIANVATRKMLCFRDAVLLLIVSLGLMGLLELCQRLMNLATK